MQDSEENIDGNSTVRVRRMVAADVSFALSILKESLEASVWLEESLLESAAQGIAVVAEWKGHIAGVLIGRVAADEFEILNLAVSKASRRQGIATRMVIAAVESAQMEGAQRSYLEVRASNAAGIALYSGMGFQVCGRRANYYGNPPEDAVLLVLHRSGTAT
jgi:ribosomal protein S18 acetylase RimI-like enzyme